MSRVQNLVSTFQRPESSIKSPASRVHRPEPSVWSSESSVQSPASRVHRPTLASNFNTVKNISYDAFENFVLHTLDKNAPRKHNYIRGNHSPLMKKDIHEAIMTRTRLRNISLKEATPTNRLTYKKQSNYCVSLMRKNKKQYYGSLNANRITNK